MNSDNLIRPGWLSLTDWIRLSSHFETEQYRQRAEQLCNAGKETITAYYTSKREGRISRAVRAIYIGGFLLRRLAVEEPEEEDDANASFPPQDGPSLEATDILISNFVVGVNFEEDAIFFGEDLLCAEEIMNKCTQGEIGSILRSVSKVEFVSSSIQQKARMGSDEKLSDAFFQRLGCIFLELFAADSDITRRYQSIGGSAADIVSRQSILEKECNDEDDCKDEDNLEHHGKRRYSAADTCNSFKKVDISECGIENELQQAMLPMSICRLLTDLIETGTKTEDGGTFQSLDEVTSELEQIIQDPKRFLFEEVPTSTWPTFRNNQLFGRSEELQTFLQVVAEAPADSLSHVNNVVLVGGAAGCGKSHLVGFLKDVVTQNNWLFLSTKFDRSSQGQSLNTFGSAFNDLFQHFATVKSELEDGNLENAAEELYITNMLASIEHNLSASGIVVLSDLIPSFRSLFPDIFRRVVEDCISDDESSCKSQTNEGDAHESSDDEDGDRDCLLTDTYKHRVHYLFRKLMNAISSPEQPVFLFVDDLQFADAEHDAALELLTSLTTDFDDFQAIHDDNDDNENQPCFVVAGTFRAESVDRNSGLQECFRALETSSKVRVTHINLEGLEEDGIHAMITDALHLPGRLTKSFASIVHKKSLGNPMYARLFVFSLVEEGALNYSIAKRRWIWNLKAAESVSIHDNIAVMMISKLSQMNGVQKALAILSCFGMQVNESVLHSLSFDKLVTCVEWAIQEGLVERKGSCVSFAHDIIQEACYNLLPQEEMSKLHILISIRLAEGESPNEPDLNTRTTLAIDQVAKANESSIESLEVPTKRLFVKLLLKAIERSIDTADSSADAYVSKALQLLGPCGWQSDFKLCLKVHEAACMAFYLNGQPDKSLVYLDKIMAHTSDFMARLKSYYMMIRTLSSLGKVKEAMAKAFDVLRQLDEIFPANATLANVQSVISSTKELLAKNSVEDILNSPRILDERKFWCLKIMDLMIPFLWLSSPLHLPLVGMRMVEISVQYGLCKESAFGIFCYVDSTVRFCHDIDEGVKWSKVSRGILDRFGAVELLPRLTFLQHSFLNFWVEPMNSIPEIMFQSSRDALRFGNIEYASFSAHLYCQFILRTGTPLPKAEMEFSAVTAEMVRLKQIRSCIGHLSNHQTVLALAGSDKNPFDFPESIAKNEDELLLIGGKTFLSQVILSNRILTACFFRRNKYASEVAEKYGNLCKERMHFHGVFFVFYEGVTAFQMARSEPDEPKWKDIGQKALDNYREWVHHSSWNFENKLLLLEAQLLFCEGDLDYAEKKYIASIESAKRHRFLHEQGLAMDLLASFYKTIGNTAKAVEYFGYACDCYEQWGAFGLLRARKSEFEGVQ